jgi:hypothetical protein
LKNGIGADYLGDDQFKEILLAVDTDGNGKINYTGSINY